MMAPSLPARPTKIRTASIPARWAGPTSTTADYSATHSGGSLSTGGPVGKDLLTNMAGGSLSGANNSGHAEGTTKAGVSEGTLIVRDTDKQQQDVGQLNRDTEHANDGSISPIFNKEKEQKRLKQAQLIGEIGGRAMDVIRTQEISPG